MITVSPNTQDIFIVLISFLTAILPPGVIVEQGQINRVSEPSAPDYVVMWPLRMPRIATNLDDYVDAVFTGSITGDTMDITAVNPAYTGQIAVGSVIFGVGVATNTTVTALGTGSGGVGTYIVTPSQTIGSEVLAAGIETLLQATEIVMQLDVHGPNSQDNAQIITTIFRDEAGVDLFSLSGFDVTPLYTDEPRQSPFLNDQNQYEDRWTVDAHMQANITLSIPQQFFDELTVTTFAADVLYPPT